MIGFLGKKNWFYAFENLVLECILSIIGLINISTLLNGQRNEKKLNLKVFSHLFVIYTRFCTVIKA